MKKSRSPPFSGLISDVNGELEINPDLVNDSASTTTAGSSSRAARTAVQPRRQATAWNLMEHDEYAEYLAELYECHAKIDPSSVKDD